MTDIYYIDSESNYYDIKRDVVVLDEKLKDYPKALKYIRKHEIKHSEMGKNPLKHILHDLKNDIYCTSGNDQTAKELREYRKELRKNKRSQTLWIIANEITHFGRNVLGFLLIPLFYICSKIIALVLFISTKESDADE